MSNANRRILVVEDESAVLSAINQALEGEFEIVTAQSRDMALDLIRNANLPFQVIVTDQHLGDGLGNAVLSEVLFLNPYTVRVIFSGADDAGATAVAINEARVDHYIEKSSTTAFDELRAVCEWGVEEYKRRVEHQMGSNSALLEWYKSATQERFAMLTKHLPNIVHGGVWEIWKPRLPSPPPYSAIRLWKDANAEIAYQTYIGEGLKTLLDRPELAEQYTKTLEGQKSTGNPVAGVNRVVSPLALINLDRKVWRKSIVAFALGFQAEYGNGSGRNNRG
jgi:DNA-binding NarL/FixJ family response regulator